MKNKFYLFYILSVSLFCPVSALGTPEKNDPPGLDAVFIGNAAFRISDGNTVLMMDFPYKSGAYGYMTYAYDFAQETKDRPILSLISHRHDDHFSPLIFLEQGWKIIGPSEVAVQFNPNLVVPLSDKINFGAMTIHPRKSPHAHLEHYSYQVNWNGKVLFFTGDTEDLDVLDNLPALDALFITPWFYRRAYLHHRLPKSNKIIIYHHKANTIVPACGACIIPQQNQVIPIGYPTNQKEEP